MGDDPFRIDGPAIISFSAGRSSGYLLWRILQAHGGTLPPDIVVCFANTGKEMRQSLDFVHQCSEQWGVAVVWLEYRRSDNPQERWRQVDYATASRNGEPFEAIISEKELLPGPTQRFCTIELKVRTMKFYAQQALGWKYWTNVLGLRADEMHRVKRMVGNAAREVWENSAPLAVAGITKRVVYDFWRTRNFDLELPSINNKTPHGNCDFCFLKSAGTISAMMRDVPDQAQWWIDQENRVKGIARGNGQRFRNDRPSYAAMLDGVKRQTPFDFGDLDELNDCICGT